jgi:hypothetical protein
MWVRRPNNKNLFIAAFLFGLGLTNYQVILLAGIALAICIMMRDFKLLQNFVIAGIPYAVVIALIMHLDKSKVFADYAQHTHIQPKSLEDVVKNIGDMSAIFFKFGALPPVIHPTNITMYVYMFLNFAWLSIIYFVFPRGKTVAPTILFALLGLAFYLYMPIVSDLRNPPMNWGYPRTWEGFMHAITRGQYEKIVPAHIFSIRFVKQIGVYLADLRLNYRLPIALIGFLPFAAWRIHIKDRDYPVMTIAIVLAAITAVLDLVAWELPGHISLYKVSAAGVILIAAIGALAIIVARITHIIKTHLLSSTSAIMEKITAAGVLAGIVMAVAGLVTRDVLNVTAPMRHAEVPLTPEQIKTIIADCGVIGAMVAAILLAIAVVFFLLHTKINIISVHEESQNWMMSTTVTFIIL